jgi:phospholipid/cholesterol/gamma-HCH transport system substrate-binding protein
MLPPRDPNAARGETIQQRQNGSNGPNGIGQRQSARRAGAGARSSGVIARIAALAALGAAIVLVVLVLFTNSSSYTLRANFQDAGGLVAGDDVLIGPASVGSVQSIGLTASGQAQVVVGLDGSDAPMHQGTVARIYENSLSGLANKYVVLEPGPQTAPEIKDGGLITSDHTRSSVNLDQLFDVLDPLTRRGLRQFIRGEAASIQGRALEGNQTLRYLAPALASTSDVTAEISRDEPIFDSLLVQGAQAFQTLASRSQELTQLIANTNATTAAIAGQSQALQQALVLLAPALNHSTRTFAGLRSTLDALDPLVTASKPATRRLTPFAIALRKLTDASIPTVGQLDTLISNPSGAGDLTSLFLQTPSLAKLAHAAFPRLITAMNDSQKQLDYLREFTPDIVGALTNLGQVSAYYDANGHYARTQPMFGAFGLDGANQLTSKPPFERYQGLQVVRSRCPGGAVQPAPDGSSPFAVPGCQPTSTPPGP